MNESTAHLNIGQVVATRLSESHLVPGSHVICLINLEHHLSFLRSASLCRIQQYCVMGTNWFHEENTAGF